MISKFQFESVMKLLASGVNNYVQLRQQVGLTSDELDDILENISDYKKKFEEQDRIEELAKLQQTKKKHWWQK